MTTIPIRASLAQGYRLTWRPLGTSLVVVAVVQGAVALIASPVLLYLVEVALRSAGLRSVTNSTVLTVLRNPLSLTIVLLAVVLVVAVLLIQVAVFLDVARMRLAGEAVRARPLARRMRQRGRVLARRPSTLLLVPYFLLLVPLGHVGIGSVLTQWVSVPTFVSGELTKEPTTAIAYYALLAVIWYVNIRLILMLPFVMGADVPVGTALVRSWRATRWQSWRMVVLLASVIVPAVLASLAIHLVVIFPTWIADLVAPDTSFFVAAVGFGVAQVAVFFVVGMFALVQATTMMHVIRVTGRAPDEREIVIAPGASERDFAGERDRTAGSTRRGRFAVGGIIAGAALVAVGMISWHILPVMEDASDGSTLILGHRGFPSKGVENTIPSLEAAHAVGADLIEFDTLQTADHQWVVIHDTDLTRLAGQGVAVADLTLDELTAITVRASGNEAPIPSLENYLKRASALEQQLLIEVKVHGRESEDYLDTLLATIDAVDGADEHIYHTLSDSVVDGLAQLRPELTVGYIVPVAFGAAADSSGAFLVYEEGSYTRTVRDEVRADGRAIFVWTVDEEESMRELFRDKVDAIITDQPDVARRVLTEVTDETGMAGVLWDALSRFIVSD